MWDEEDVVVEENTQVFKRRGQADAQLPPEKPILLLNRLEDALEPVEIVEIAELQTRRPPPPRRHLPAPASPSLVEATPTRPGRHGYSNDVLFAAPVVERPVTPTLPALEALPKDEDRNSVSLAPAVMEPWLAASKPRRSRRLELGAVAAVLLAAASYLHGPFDEEPPGRASVSWRSSEVVAAYAAPASDDDAASASAEPRRARHAGPSRARTSVGNDAVSASDDDAEAADGSRAPATASAEHDDVDEATDATEVAPPSDEAASETADKLTQALAPGFNVGAAKAALAAASGNASACGDGAAAGSARVSVTFAHSGRVTAAVVDGGSPLAGTTVGSCVARVLQQASVPTYSGKVVTVVTRVTVR